MGASSFSATCWWRPRPSHTSGRATRGTQTLDPQTYTLNPKTSTLNATPHSQFDEQRQQPPEPAREERPEREPAGTTLASAHRRWPGSERDRVGGVIQRRPLRRLSARQHRSNPSTLNPTAVEQTRHKQDRQDQRRRWPGSDVVKRSTAGRFMKIEGASWDGGGPLWRMTWAQDVGRRLP